MAVLADIKDWARRVKRDAVMLWFAQRHPDTPWHAKLLCVCTVAYALSPIDLIPDFIPVLGYLDEVFLLPGMIWLAVRLLPHQVVQHCRGEADRWLAERKVKPTSYVGAVVIVSLWIAVLVLTWQWLSGTI